LAGTTSDETSRKRIPFAALCVVFAGMLGDALFHRSALVEPIEPSLRIIGIVVGSLFGFGTAIVLAKSAHRSIARTISAIIAAPLFGAAIGSYCVRTAFEFVHFLGAEVTSKTVQAQVVGLNSKWETSANIKIGEHGREIFVDVTPDLYERLDPYRTPGRDCLKLLAEIGREGIVRLIVPAKWLDDSLGVDRLAHCNA
jgi:hypothetical protein